MKIRDKNGEIIDLGEVRTYLSNARELTGKARETYIVDVNTFEATEGMLRVQEAAHAAQRDFIGVATHHIEPLLDALEAALSVQTSTPASDTWQRGWNACKNAVRDAAGVIEEPV